MIARIAHATSLSGHGIEIAAAMAGLIASALLIATIIGRSASTIAVLAIAMVVSLTAALPPWATVAAALGAIAGQYPARFVRNRRTVVRCAVFVMGACGLVAGAAALLTGQTPGESVSTGLQAALTGCLGAALWFALLTMLERPFQLTTPLGLLELLDPTRTILERFSRQAPGTFAHSLMVGHLAASAADAIGADALLCRVAAQYHDIGKLCRAQFFKENQQGGNVHDRLAPSLSAIIVNSHVRDGERMAKELGLPPVIQDIIMQHHGTTLMRYFYFQAAGGLDPAKADALQSQFRYPGPKPQSREAGIMMLADACEAASRTLRNPSREKIRALVDDIVDDRIGDKQLDECPLTLRDITAIRSALADVICATMHERVEYPAGNRRSAGRGQPKPSASHWTIFKLGVRAERHRPPTLMRTLIRQSYSPSTPRRSGSATAGKALSPPARTSLKQPPTAVAPMRSALRTASRLLRVQPGAELSVLLTDDSEIRQLNRDYRDASTSPPTFSPSPRTTPLCSATSSSPSKPPPARPKPRIGRSNSELALLAVHGFPPPPRPRRRNRSRSRRNGATDPGYSAIGEVSLCRNHSTRSSRHKPQRTHPSLRATFPLGKEI